MRIFLPLICLAFLFSLTGCLQSKVKTITKTEIVRVPTLPTPGEERSATETGGGFDGSGGDAQQSTIEQVQQAIGEPQEKLLVLFERLALHYSFNGQVSFQDLHGLGSGKVLHRLFGYEEYPNILDVLRNADLKIIVNDKDACQGDFKDHEGSATGTIDSGEICISTPLLRRLSPESLEIQILALLIHEIAHLYGFDEKDARLIQSLIVDKRHLHWPLGSVAELLQQFYSSVVISTTELQHQILENESDASICQEMGSLLGSLDIYQNLFSQEDPLVQIPQLHMSNSSKFSLIHAGAQVRAMLNYCGQTDPYKLFEKVDSGNRAQLAEAALNLGSSALSVWVLIDNYLNPHSRGTTLEAMVLNTSFRLSASEKFYALDAPSSPIRCTVGKIGSKGVVEQPRSYEPSSIVKDESAEAFAADLGAPKQYAMIRKFSGVHGYEIVFMSQGLTEAVFEVGSGMSLSGGTESNVLPWTYLLPGKQDTVQLTYKVDGNPYRLMCTTTGEDRYVEIPLEKAEPAREVDDRHYIEAARGEVTLYGDDQGHRVLFGLSPIRHIKYVGTVLVVRTENKDFDCIIPEPVAARKGDDLYDLGKRLISDGKVQLSCIVTGRMGAKGEAERAAWATDYEVAPSDSPGST